MSPKEAADLSGVARGTLNGWTSGEFKDYFSTTAQGGSGRNRDYTEHDVRLLVLLRQMTDAHNSRDEIHTTLRQMQSVDWRDLPDIPYNQNSAVVPMVPTAAADAAITSERRMYVTQIKVLEDQLARAQQQADAERQRNEPLLREIGDLQAEKARLELLIELYESGRLKPKE